jgi:hypothetical protein
MFTLNMLDFFIDSILNPYPYLKRLFFQCKMNVEMQWKRMNGFMKAKNGVVR